MNRKKFIPGLKIAVLFFTLLITKSAMCQEQRVITLQEAIDLSVKNSKLLKAGTARILAAEAGVTEAEDNRLPGFSVSGSYLRLNSPNVALKIKALSGTGTDSSRPATISQAMYGIASLSYPLYAGGKIKFGIESAKFLEQAAKLDVDNDKQGVILNTVDAFINLYKSSKVIWLIKESLDQSRKRDTDFLRLENNGLLARNDRLKASLQTSNIELSLLDAENNQRIAGINLDLMLGLPENTILNPDSSSLHPVTGLKTLDEYEQMALQSRKDIEALSYRQKAAATGIKIARAETYPTIALTGGYIAAYVPNLLTITNAVNIGVGVQYNLAGLWKTNTNLQKAKAREQELLANSEQMNDGIRLQVNKDYENYLLSTKKIDVYNKAMQQAEENFRITKNKYDNSLVTTTDLLDADVAQLQARLNLTLAKADVIAAYNKLLQTTGGLNKQ